MLIMLSRNALRVLYILQITFASAKVHFFSNICKKIIGKLSENMRRARLAEKVRWNRKKLHIRTIVFASIPSNALLIFF